MSDSTPTAPLRLLKSPFNGETWTVPPDVSEEMYQELLKRGFTRVDVKPSKKERASA